MLTEKGHQRAFEGHSAFATKDLIRNKTQDNERAKTATVCLWRMH